MIHKNAISLGKHIMLLIHESGLGICMSNKIECSYIIKNDNQRTCVYIIMKYRFMYKYKLTLSNHLQLTTRKQLY